MTHAAGVMSRAYTPIGKTSMKLRFATLFLMAMVAPALVPSAWAQVPAPSLSRPGAAPPAMQTPARRTATRPSASADAGPALVDINSADLKTLDALPGIGPARAKAIVAGRPYAEKNDLLTRKIIPANAFAGIEGMIALINVNTASAADMAKVLPNVGPVRAEAIVKNRPYASPQEMVAKGALTQGVFDGIKPMVTAR